MTRKLKPEEKRGLPELPIVIEKFEGSHPFSGGDDPDLYLEDELKKKADKKSSRTDWFEKRLFAISRELGGEVPYAFRVRGALRSLDAGCLGYLVNRRTPELALSKDNKGYIVGVTPIGPLASRYTTIEDRLRAEVRRPPAEAPAIAAVPAAISDGGELRPDGAHVALETTQVVDDIAALTADESLSDTEREQLIDARKGQGAFRVKVLRSWNHRCAVTGCELEAVLRASHIKPWRAASNEERLDSENGLLLVATIDALFDCGLISFDDDGKVLFSPRLEVRHHRLVPEPRRLSRPLTAKARDYLAGHRKTNGFG